MEGIIYKYTNKVNGKVYIGQTLDEEKPRDITIYQKDLYDRLSNTDVKHMVILFVQKDRHNDAGPFLLLRNLIGSTII